MSTSIKLKPVPPFVSHFIILVGTIASSGGTLQEAVNNARDPRYVLWKGPESDYTVTNYFMQRGYDGADVPHHLRNPQLGFIFTDAIDMNPEANERFAIMERMIDSMGRSYAESHLTNGEKWPDDAEFALVTRFHAWPIGWAKEKRVEFFNDREGMDRAVALCKHFAELEDNYVAYQGYKWDLGPELMPDVVCNENNL